MKFGAVVLVERVVDNPMILRLVSACSGGFAGDITRTWPCFLESTKKLFNQYILLNMQIWNPAVSLYFMSLRLLKSYAVHD